MKKILLTKNKFSFVDEEDFIILNKYKWYANETRNSFYACRRGQNKKFILMHREIMEAKKGQIIDHINGIGTDNRKSNLRFVTHQENLLNRGKQKNNSTGYKGVYPSFGKYVARITVDKKFITIGRFKKAKQAAIAYDKFVLNLRGKLAVLNFPGGAS